MFGLVFTKILTKTIVAAVLTLALVILSNYDTSSENLKKVTLEEAISGLQDPFDEAPEVLNKSDNSKKFVEPIIFEDEEDIELGEGLKTVKIKGTASHYANKFHGRLTANGEVFNMYAYTCANKNLPFGTIIKIKNVENDEVVLVRVNDRGPYVNDRIIDLSYKAAQEIGDLGLPRVEAEYVSKYADVEKDSHYIGFSKSNPIRVFSSENIEIISKTDDFTIAVRTLNELSEESNINNHYLFVKAGPKYYKEDTFYVGKVKTDVLFASK